MSHESFERAAPVHGSSNRTFGLVFAVFFLLVVTFPLIRGRPPRLWAAPISIAFLIVALLLPAILAPLNRGWMRVGLLLNRITNPIVLGLMFYLVITPVGLIMRMFGKDPLRLRMEPTASTYWIDRTPPGPPPASLERQF